MISNKPQVLAIHKPIGVPSHRVAIELSKKFHMKVSHTGNLDPMAEGVLVFLIGTESLKKQSVWQDADKEYEFDVVFGFSTDSYDQLGMVTELEKYEVSRHTIEELTHYIKDLKGKQAIKRPAYSYKMIRGKPLYWWAREGRLNEIKLPEVKVEIYDTELLETFMISKGRLKARIIKNVNLAMGDFRQKEILNCWEGALAKHSNKRFCVARIRVACSKGTYIRSIAHDLGNAMGIPSFALRILRTRNGDFKLGDCIKMP